MGQLTIQHVVDSDAFRFQVTRANPPKQASAVSVPSPYGFPVEGRGS